MPRHPGKVLWIGIFAAAIQGHFWVQTTSAMLEPGIEGSSLETTVQHAPPPEFSVRRGTFEKAFTLSLTVALEGASIRYTTDGSEPGSASGKIYNSPLQITNTTVIRAAVYKKGSLPSKAQTHSYIFLDQVIYQPKTPAGFPASWGFNAGFAGGLIPAAYQMNRDPLRVNPNDASSPIDPIKAERFRNGLRELPWVSIVMKTEDMFGPKGLYPNAEEAMMKPKNGKVCSVEMILPDGMTAFAVDCGIDLHGNASRNPLKSPKHGFKLTFRSATGPSELKYALFPDSPAKRFDHLILRPDFGVSWLHWSDSPVYHLGGQQRTRAARIRDPWLKNTFCDMGHVASYNRFCHLFINGLYWGVYDFTEQPTASFARNYFPNGKNGFDILDQGALKSGDLAAYEAMTRLSNLENRANYEKMKSLLDIPEFIDYTLLHFFVGHQDWGYQKNWYAIRKRGDTADGTFKYIPWDGENHLLDENIDRIFNPDVPSGLHTKLMRNAEYRLTFADHVFKHMLAPGGALTPAMNIARWNKWQAIMDKPIVAESMRWGNYRRDIHPFSDGEYELYTRETHWLRENDRVTKSYLVKRNSLVLRSLRQAGLYPILDAPVFSSAKGKTIPELTLTLTGPAGNIYYTTNGLDPRVSFTGAISAGATRYAGVPLPLTGPLSLKARTFDGRNWSALNEGIFTNSP